ncbi:AI-2E family transporter [Campylobacter sp. 19-13652]|uniref:AI-2E family transporter n=1 Tax=Campylobacter sp. 19-13652 TaxID=2840180 RepID=UPI0021A52167|nr:AI-2E family transporter [Campylobacter sp. 19-13652]
MRGGQYFLVVLVLLALGLLVYLFKPFLLSIFIAALLAVAMANLNVFFLRFLHNKTISAGFTTAFLLFLFLAPLSYAIVFLANYAANFNTYNITRTIEYFKDASFHLPETLAFLEPKFKELISELDLSVISSKLLPNLASLGKLSVNFIVDMGFILVFFFFALLYGSQLIGYLKQSLPMRPDETESVLSEVANVMSVVFYSIIANMIIQGTLFAVITAHYGYDALLTGMFYAVASLIPAVGGLLVWAPISLYEFASGNTEAAVVIAVYTVIVISLGADTFLKPLVIKFINDKLVKIPTKINELLIFFAMLAGLSSFGFWGIILGPAIITLFISTIRLYTLMREVS